MASATDFCFKIRKERPILRVWRSEPQPSKIGVGLQALRESYASPWNSWTLVEAMDNKSGRRFKKKLETPPSLEALIIRFDEKVASCQGQRDGRRLVRPDPPPSRACGFCAVVVTGRIRTLGS